MKCFLHLLHNLHPSSVKFFWRRINGSLLIDCRLTVCYIPHTDSKTLKEEKREELFENLKEDSSIGWEVDVIDPRELSAKMLQR